MIYKKIYSNDDIDKAVRVFAENAVLNYTDLNGTKLKVAILAVQNLCIFCLIIGMRLSRSMSEGDRFITLEVNEDYLYDNRSRVVKQ